MLKLPLFLPVFIAVLCMVNAINCKYFDCNFLLWWWYLKLKAHIEHWATISIYGYIETILFPHIYFPIEPPLTLISSWISNEVSLEGNSLESAALYGKKIPYNRYISAQFFPKNTLSRFLFFDIEYDGGAIITFWQKKLSGKNKEKYLHRIVLTF